MTRAPQLGRKRQGNPGGSSASHSWSAGELEVQGETLPQNMRGRVIQEGT